MFVGDQSAIAQHQDAAAGGLDAVEAVGGHDHRGFLAQLAEQLADGVLGLGRPEAEQRLVENEHLRLVEDGLGEPEAAAIAEESSATGWRAATPRPQRASARATAR